MVKRTFTLCFMLSTIIFQSLGQLQKIDSLKELASQADDSTKLNLYIKISSLYSDINLDTANIYLSKIDSIIKRTDNKKYTAISEHNKGNYYFKTGEYDKALKYYRNALKFFKEIQNKNKIASTLNNIGTIFEKKGEYEKALEHFLRALNVQESMNNKEEVAKIYLNIGLIHMRIGNYEKADEYYNKSKKIRQEINDKEGLALVYNNMAILYYYTENYDNVRNYFEKAYEIYKELGNDRKQAMTLSNLGQIYVEIGKFDKALKSYKTCLEIEKKLKDKDGLIGTYQMTARVLRQRGEYDKALSNLSKGLEIAKETNSSTQIKNLYEVYYSVYKEKKDYKNALKWHEKYFTMYDSVLNAEKTKHLNELQTKYETEKKEQEIKLLNKEKKVQELKIKKQRYFNYSIGVIALVTLVFALILFLQKKKILAANKKLTEQQKQITDSITYASRIQNAILPDEKQLNNIFFDNYFILFKPKGLVSGDFYFADEKNGKKIIASVDCTGHGVPGAFMSLLGYSYLTEIINSLDTLEANVILNKLRDSIILALRQRQEIGTGKDGMDISLLIIDKQNQELQFAGAYQIMLHLRNGNIQRYKGDKMPVGIHYKQETSFTQQTIPFEKDDMIYLFSDGFVDQFGGPKNKKFRLKNFEQLLTNIYEKPLDEQRYVLNKTFDDWKSGKNQIDDVVVVGIRL